MEVVPLRVTLMPDGATPLLPCELPPERAGICVLPLTPVSRLIAGPVQKLVNTDKTDQDDRSLSWTTSTQI